MATESTYYSRMWAVIDREQDRFTAKSDISAFLIDRLHADFNGKKEIFSAEEYRDPAIRESILALLTKKRDIVIVPREIARSQRTFSPNSFSRLPKNLIAEMDTWTGHSS